MLCLCLAMLGIFLCDASQYNTAKKGNQKRVVVVKRRGPGRKSVVVSMPRTPAKRSVQAVPQRAVSSRIKAMQVASRPAGILNNARQNNDLHLTKEEQEALDADLALNLMLQDVQNEDLELENARQSYENDAAYARQLEAEEREAADQGIRQEPVQHINQPAAIPAPIVPVIPNNSSPIPVENGPIVHNRIPQGGLPEISEQLPAQFTSIHQHVNSILTSILTANVNGLELRNVLIQSRHVSDALLLAHRIGQLAGLKVEVYAFGGLLQLPIEMAERAFKRFLTAELVHGERQNSEKRMIIIPLNKSFGDANPQVEQKRARLRKILEEYTQNLKKRAMIVVIAKRHDPICTTFYRRITDNKSFVIALEDTLLANAPDQAAQSSSSSTSAAPEVQRSQSSSSNSIPVEISECPICMEKQADMQSSCCSQSICKGCWEDSLQATSNAGKGGHARQCPFCKLEHVVN